MAYEDLITLKELSPELRQLISSSGGITTSGLIVIDDIYTKKVEATIEGQTEFEIPFEQYDSVNSYLDVKINSTWVNPDRYSIVGSKIVLVEGVSLGTVIYFTIFSLAEATPDGGFIEDVDVAETPQEVIIYDGGIIDEKVSEHNVSSEAHADIRNLIEQKVNIKSIPIEASVDLFTLDEGHYMYEGEIPQGKNYPTQLTGFRHVTITVIGRKTNSENGYQVIQIFDAYSGHYENTKAWDSWSGWVQFATTINTSALDNKIGELSQGLLDRGMWTYAKVLRGVDLNTVMLQGFYTFNSYSSSNNQNTPTPNQDITYQMLVIRETDVTCIQLAMQSYPQNGERVFYRNCSIGTWSEWKQIATNTKTTVKITPLNGFGAWGIGSSAVKVGNTVTLHLRLASTEATVASYTLIAQLPEGYRPLVPINSPIQQAVGVTKHLSINPDGEIKIPDQAWEKSAWHIGTFTYVTD